MNDLSEINFKNQFFSQLNYSFGNEDWETERRALRIQPGDNVVCITASGDRTLDLLFSECGHITSVDASPAQNHLLKLKCAALEAFDYETYLGFLGGAEFSKARRVDLLQSLLPGLGTETANFWRKNLDMIQEGVLYQGHIERLAQRIATIAYCFRPWKVETLFSISDLETQRKFVREEWDTYLMRKVFDISLSHFVSSTFSVDPGLYAYLGSSIQVGSYIYDRMLESLNRHLAKENLLISLIFRGIVTRDAFPPYLQEDSSRVIKGRLSRLSLVTENVVEHLKYAPDSSYDKFSLSDIASYMSQEEFDTLVQHVYRTAKPNARFCIRQFSSDHKIPQAWRSHFQREEALEKSLEREDRCFVYRFMVGHIAK